MDVDVESSGHRAFEDAATVLEVEGLTKHFRRPDGELVRAVENVSLTVKRGECLVLLGPSGCGKTTLLRSIAGIEDPDEGRITVAGTDVFSSASGVNLLPQRRPLSMVFQSYALWPHMTALDNVAYPLRRGTARMGKTEARDIARSKLRQVGVEEVALQHPGEMSGGQQQRVALARALVTNDGLILFDEPLSNVDAKVRERLRVEFAAMQRDLGFAAVFVTHDQLEAMEVGHTVAVLEGGQIEQIGDPRSIYHEPTSAYVADFVGSSNSVPCEVVQTDGELVTVRSVLGSHQVSRGASGAGEPQARLYFRPEAVTLDGGAGVEATVERTLFCGSYVDHHCRVDDQTVVARSMDRDLPEGSTTTVSVRGEAVSIL